MDQAAVQKAAAELLGNWNTSMAYKPMAAAYKKMAPINQKIETPDKANAQFEAGVRFQMSENDPDYPAMLLAGYMFGGPITSRVSDRIRNREGLSYGANARVAIPAEGDSALLSGTVSLNPVNGPKVEASFKDELAKTLREGFTAAEVAEAEKVPLVDLNEIIARRYDALGPEKVEPLFGDPHTHTSRAGAELNAACVIAGLKGLAANPLARFFSDKANGVAPYSAVR